MNIRHKVLKDYQLTTSDKKIIILKSGSILEDYKYGTKNDFIKVDKETVDQNPDFFQLISWKIELVNVLKQSKIPQPSIVAKKIIPFLDEIFIQDVAIKSDNKNDDDYKSKFNSLHDKELEYDKIIRNQKDIESDFEYKLQKLNKKESELKIYTSEIESKEFEIRRKSKELLEKEESLRDYESNIKKRERELDNIVISSEKDTDSKHREMYSKIKLQLKELEDKEKIHNNNMNRIEDRERELITIQDNISIKNKEFRDKESELIDKELEHINKIRNIKSKLMIINESIPWIHLPSNLKSIFNEVLNDI